MKQSIQNIINYEPEIMQEKLKIAKDKRKKENHWKYTFGGAVFAIFGKTELLSESDAPAFQDYLYKHWKDIQKYIVEYNASASESTSESVNAAPVSEQPVSEPHD